MVDPPRSEAPTYTRDEMDAILKRAIERQQAKSEGIGHEELVEAAGEVGIPREEVEAAARDLAREKKTREDVVARASVPDEDRGRALRKLYRNAASWVVFSVFFYFLAHMNGHDGTWWVWAVGGWGFSVAMQAVRVFFGEPAGHTRQSSRDRRRVRRQEKMREFEERVAVGTDALVRAIEHSRAARPRLAESQPQVRVGERDPAFNDDETSPASPAGAKRKSGRPSAQ